MVKFYGAVIEMLLSMCVCVCVCSVADLRKQFEREPLSTAVELQSTAQLQCLPPVGEPPPQVSFAPCTFFPQHLHFDRYICFFA